MGKELTLIGVIDDSGYELENRVYSRGGAERNTSISHSYRATISFEKI